MNGNRSKYTYTPTYGMQKRGLTKKSASIRQVPEAPDFTQVPDPAIGVPLQQVMPQQSGQTPAAFSQPDSMPPVPSYFSSMQQASANQLTSAPVQFPFAAPTFIQQGQQPLLPPLQQTMAQQSFPQPPIGSSIQQPNHAFNARTQGFVPPQANTAPNVQAANTMPPQIGWANPQMAQQSIPPFSGSGMNAPQQIAPFQMQQAQAFPPLQPVPQQSGFTVQAAAPHAAPRVPSMDADKLCSIFLFGLLPLLFIPCLFLSSSWDALRYIFLGAAVAGMGVMWFRQMYTSAARLIVSIVYVALCIGTIAMLMQGATDARQAAASLGQQQAQTQTTPTPPADAAAAAALSVTPTPEPTVTGPSEAEKRLSLFMELWKVNNTTEMVNLVQPSWRGQQENASTSLFVALANRTPEDFTIEDISGTETDNSRTITMRATINKNTGKAPVVYRFMVMMVKEGGEWYVNPNSLATNDAQQTANNQEENVVKTQSSGTVTEPPRETVTPAPPASTLLYYNIGGNYYHMDPECPSVGKDYLPFDASFSYADLRSYKRELLPCLNCNAPTDTLD